MAGVDSRPHRRPSHTGRDQDVADGAPGRRLPDAGLLAVGAGCAAVTAPLLVIPVVLSAMIVRLRTVADGEAVTARTLLGSRTVRWDDIDGPALRPRAPGRGPTSSDGAELRLPAVTFATLPLLTEASARPGAQPLPTESRLRPAGSRR